jgi:hypothetical protein
MPRQTVLREQVARAVDEGARLDEVEAEVIAGAPVSPEARDALWLYAWTLLDGDEGFAPERADQRRFSR